MQARDAENLLLVEEILKLDEWLETEEQSHFLYQHIFRIRKKLHSGLKYSAYVADYLEDAIAVNMVLADQHDNAALDRLLTRAKTTIGSSIPERKIMGAALGILGIALLAVSVLLMSSVIACTFPLAGFFMVLAGNTSAMLSIGIFRSGMQRGMARELDGLHGTLVANSTRLG